MFDVIVDTREQVPWNLSNSSLVENIIIQKLATGDYTISGMEDKLCIERKKSVSELAANITDPRFERELQRMAKFKYKFLILEFSYINIDQYPLGSNIPLRDRSKVKITGNFIIKRLSEIAIKYNIHVLACDNCKLAEHVATSLMKRVYENETKK